LDDEFIVERDQQLAALIQEHGHDLLGEFQYLFDSAHFSRLLVDDEEAFQEGKIGRILPGAVRDVLLPEKDFATR
jgi:hypothetical protein